MKKTIFVVSAILVIGVAAAIYGFYGNVGGSGYRGQKLSYLGDPQILGRYPEEFVEKSRARLNTAIDFTKKIRRAWTIGLR